MTLITTLLLTFTIILAVVAMMAIGVIKGRAPIRGSCGGLNGGGCELCSGECKREAKT